MMTLLIKLILIGLLIFTPIPFGSMDLWAFSLMELGVLSMIVLWAIQSIVSHRQSGNKNQPSAISDQPSALAFILLLLFLSLILLQMLPLSPEIIKVISPKTYALRQSLALEPSALTFPLSFVPFLTKIEFQKWLILGGLFFFLLRWRGSDKNALYPLIPVIMGVGMVESIYGMLEFFSGHRHILNLDMDAFVVTGTFVNRNYFAGYLLMVIPVSLGYFFSRGAFQSTRLMGWRQRLSTLDGKTVLIAFGIILMILGLIFSASRMGIVSLLLSFSLVSFLFRESRKGERFSKTTVLIFALAFLWAAWIGLDAVVSRFFSVSEGFEGRWKIWTSTFEIIKDFPVFGSGLGTFIQVFPMYRSYHVRGLVTHAENDFLQLISETGAVGIGLLLILFLFLFFRAVSGIRSRPSRDKGRYIGISGMVGILALMFHSLVERNIQVPANAFLYTFIWAVVLRISTKETKETR